LNSNVKISEPYITSENGFFANNIPNLNIYNGSEENEVQNS
jgi:hypothetical protein